MVAGAAVPPTVLVVLVAGYADVVNGFSREFIHWGFSEFAKTVLELGEGFTFAWLMRPFTLSILNQFNLAHKFYSPNKDKISWYNPEQKKYLVNRYYQNRIILGGHKLLLKSCHGIIGNSSCLLSSFLIYYDI